MNKLSRYLTVLLVLALCLTAFSGAVLAADGLDISIPVQVQQTGTLIETDDVAVITLTAEDAAAPMPDGSKDGVYALSIEGEGDGVLEISYDALGVYHYTIAQQTGSKANCTYDATVYNLTVYVTNAEAGGLELTTVLTTPSQSEKCEEAVFVNTYEAGDPALVTPSVTKVVQDEKGVAPSGTVFTFQITGQEDAPLPEETQVSITGAGTVSFGDISFDADCVGKLYAYTISEVQGSAAGYTYDTAQYQMVVAVTAQEGEILTAVSYLDEDGQTVDGITFTNVYVKPAATLPQTGQLWWPVMVLAAAGALLVACGLMMKRRGNV